MKSKLLKTMMLASSLAFFNCGDDAATSAISNYSGLSSNSAAEVQPGDDSSSSTSDVQGGELNQQGGTEISSAAESSSATA